MHRAVRVFPGVILGAFGVAVVLWLGQESLQSILLIPATVGALGIVYSAAPDQRFGQAAIVVGYVVGAAVAGFLVFGILTGPIGSGPDEVEAFIAVASPLIALYVLSVLSGIGLVLWGRVAETRS